LKKIDTSFAKHTTAIFNFGKTDCQRKTMRFNELNLRPEILEAIDAKGYTTPTPIQAQAIPAVLSGSDILAGAQTGTGKTAAFTLPLLQLLSSKPRKGKKPRALVLTPTRELAAQVAESVKVYGSNLPLKSAVVFGGVNINPQKKQFRDGVDIVVATPGRLLDHADQKTVDLSGIEILILDEADRMLDMGFIRDIRKVIKLVPKKRQNLLFSATYSKDIKRLADDLLHNPKMIEVARRNTTAETVTQVVQHIDKGQKRHLLTHLIKKGDWQQVLVFTRTKHGANRLTKHLNAAKITASAIHGNKSQNSRTRALAEFKSGEIRVLVATDIAARGLDIQQLPHVVNFELPNVPEDYVHRIGRTGRAGSNGVALSLVSPDEKAYLKGIEKLIKKKVPVEVCKEFKPIQNESPLKKKKNATKAKDSNKESNNQSKKKKGDVDKPARRRNRSNKNGKSNSQRNRHEENSGESQQKRRPRRRRY